MVKIIAHYIKCKKLDTINGKFLRISILEQDGIKTVDFTGFIKYKYCKENYLTILQADSYNWKGIFRTCQKYWTDNSHIKAELVKYKLVPPW